VNAVYTSVTKLSIVCSLINVLNIMYNVFSSTSLLRQTCRVHSSLIAWLHLTRFTFESNIQMRLMKYLIAFLMARYF